MHGLVDVDMPSRIHDHGLHAKCVIQCKDLIGLALILGR